MDITSTVALSALVYGLPYAALLRSAARARQPAAAPTASPKRASRAASAPFRTRLRVAQHTSRLGRGLSNCDALLSVAACVLYIASTYTANPSVFLLELSLCVFFSYSLLVDVYAAEDRWAQATSFQSAIDVVTIAPTYVIALLHATGGGGGGGGTPTSVLRVLRIGKALKALALAQAAAHAPGRASGKAAAARLVDPTPEKGAIVSQIAHVVMVRRHCRCHYYYYYYYYYYY